MKRRIVRVSPPDDFTIRVFRASFCAAASCNSNALPSELEAQIKTVLEDVVDEINSALDDGLVCVVMSRAMAPPVEHTLQPS
jgi:hypothetical protein